jgi:lipoprotein-anchoring transpeptidase ErfK/SrfK
LNQSVLKSVAAVLAAAALACAAAPAAERIRLLPPGVTIAGVRVGGLAAEPARARVAAIFDRRLTIVHGSRRMTIAPASLGERVDINAALGAAFSATPGSRIALPLRYSSRLVDRVVARLARRVDRAPVPARVIGATAAGPTFSPARHGVALDRPTMRAAIAQLLHDGTRPPLELLTKVVPARRTAARFGPVIVIDRSRNQLRLYGGRRLQRTFRVATGQTIYPTPAGVWRIADKQRNPWWYPPTYDSWAKGLKPVPPGPSNPLGTRWMGLNAPGVGIHGTDAPTSIGYSVSHGCIRMQVPDAEWLFPRVHVGTPVVVL